MAIKVKKVITDDTETIKISSNDSIKAKEHIAEFVRKAYSPYINEETGTWFTYDELHKVFVDTGVDAHGIKGDKGEDGKDGRDGVDGINGKDGRDGLDGYTPRKGIDYFDGKDGKNGQNGLNGRDGRDGANGQDGKDYVITETDYETIAKITTTYVDIPTKVSELENDSEFTTKEYVDEEIAKGGKVQDVQVNGTTVVTDGVANVPLATRSSGATITSVGVVGVGAYSGLNLSASSGLQVRPASETNINNRQGATANANSGVIEPRNLDFAVKAALTDGKGGAYTDAEKTAARTRIDAASSSDIPTKVSELENDSDFATKDYVDDAIEGLELVEIVTSLPETGEKNKTYLLAKSTSGDNDLYDEYMFVDSKWELLGTKQIEVDLTDYVKNTDYATSSKGGLIKSSTEYATSVSAAGYLSALTKTKDQYLTASNALFVSKGTLDNVISDYATTDDIPTKVSELENDLNYTPLEPIATLDIPSYWNTKTSATSSNGNQYQGFFNLKVVPIDPTKAIRVKIGCWANMPHWTVAKMQEVGLNPADYGDGGEDKSFGYGRYRVDLVFIPTANKSYSVQVTDVMYHTSTYRPLYYCNFAYPKTDVNDGYLFGWSMYSAYQTYNTTQATFDKLKQVFDRHIVCEIFELENCTYEWVEQQEYLASNFPNHTIGQLSIATQGRTQTGDVNQIDRTTQTFYKTTNGPMTGYSLVFNTNEPDKVTQLTTATANSTANTKISTSNKINLWKGVYYYASSTVRATNYALAGTALYIVYTSVDLRYSTNCSNNFLINKAGYDVYLIGQLDENGLFEVKQIPRTISGKTYNIEVCDETQLPTTNDGYVYVLLGQTVGTNRYSINLSMKHPIFKHNGTYLECIGVC